MPLRLDNVQSITPFDATGPGPKWVVTTRDGRLLHVSDTMYHIIDLIDGRRSAAEIAAAATAALGQPVSAEDVAYLEECVLKPWGLTEPSSTGSKRKGKKTPLIIHVPIASQRMVHPFTRLGAYLFDLRVLVPLLVLALVLDACMLLMGRADLPQLRGVHYLGVYGLVTAAVLVHEMGHLSACRRFNCHHGMLGFGLYMMFPVFYVDVTQSWRLTRKQRLFIDVGGVYFQLLFTAALAVGYFLSGSPLLYFSAVAANASLLFNFHPILKFDGYWMLTDALGVTNLHAAAQRYVAGLTSSLLQVVTRRVRFVRAALVRPFRLGRPWNPDIVAGGGAVHGETAPGEVGPAPARPGPLVGRPNPLAGLPRAAALVFQAYAIASAAFVVFFAWVMISLLPACGQEAYKAAAILFADGLDRSLSVWWPHLADQLLRLIFLGFVLYRLSLMAPGYVRAGVAAVKRRVIKRRAQAWPGGANHAPDVREVGANE